MNLRSGPPVEVIAADFLHLASRDQECLNVRRKSLH